MICKLLFVPLVVAVLVSAACSTGGDDEAGDEAENPGPAIAAPEGTSEAALAYLADQLPAALPDDPGLTATVEGGGLDLTLPDGFDPASLEELLARPSGLEFRPVLELVGPVPSEEALEQRTAWDQLRWEVTPPEMVTPEAQIVLAATDGNLYRLGPVFSSAGGLLDGSAIESATAAQDPDRNWVVRPTIGAGEGGIERFDEAAAACFDGEAVCPPQLFGLGQLAMVLDGALLAVPTAEAPTFDAEGVEIAGPFDQATAEELAWLLAVGDSRYSYKE